MPLAQRQKGLSTNYESFPYEQLDPFAYQLTMYVMRLAHLQGPAVQCYYSCTVCFWLAVISVCCSGVFSASAEGVM